jgi:SNF2 family DNA or RNA helicase
MESGFNTQPGDRLRWEIYDGRISLVGNNGDRLFPDAHELFAVVFGKSPVVRGQVFLGSPVEALKSIVFSRFPAEPVFHVVGAPPDPLSLSVGVRAEGKVVTVAPGDDQVLLENKWYPVETAALAGARQWLAELGIHEGKGLSIGQLLMLRRADNLPATLIEQTDTLPLSVGERAARNLSTIPGLRAELYPYQKDGAAFLRFVADQGIGCLLADEMGLGKTVQVIALLQSEQNALRRPSLVVAPSTILENWRRELATFAPGLAVLVHAGGNRAGTPERLAEADVVITSYDTAMRDILVLESIAWNVIVADEAQAIKNPDAQRTQVIKEIPRRVSVAVTGTPVENRLEDLWSICDFFLPGLLGDRNSFRSLFADDLGDATRLATVVSPLILRRRVAEVAKDLPERIEIPHVLRMGARLAEAYESVRQQTLSEFDTGAGIVATTRLRMLCAHPTLTMEWDADPVTDMPKFERLLELLEEIFSCGEKALVFTTYQGMTDLLMRAVPPRWPQGFFKFIDGRIDIENRQDIVDAFSEFSGFGALFLNPKAAGAGLNITAANHVIHYNPEWNPAVTDQASARAYRRKQERPVTIHHLFFADTVEEVMTDRAGFKRQLAEGAVRGHAGSVDASLILRALQVSPLHPSGR